MKKVIKIFPMIICLFFYSTLVFAEDNKSQKISVSLDVFNSSNFCGLNFEYSPNDYFDIGLGITPSVFFIIPEAEVHFFARACFFDSFIQPYIQLGCSFVAPGQIGKTDSEGNAQLNENWFNTRAGTGIKFTFGKFFYCGMGVNYSFIGKNIGPILNLKGFSPAIFAGCTIVHF